MNTYIFLNYYRDSDPLRREELLMSLNTNVHHSPASKVVVFLEDSTHASDLELNEKMILVPLDRRMEFGDVFKYVTENVEDGAVIAILNLDIFMEHSTEWISIDNDFFSVGHAEKALVCCRHNLDKSLDVWIEEDSWKKGEFCDAWVFKTPLKPDFLKEKFNFCVGAAPQCDNLMMYLMSKYYHTYSWGSKYKVYHYDVIRKKDNASEMILNHKTDMRPSRRKKEHACISAYQDWETFLIEKIEPQYVPSWRVIFKDGEETFIPI